MSRQRKLSVRTALMTVGLVVGFLATPREAFGQG